MVACYLEWCTKNLRKVSRMGAWFLTNLVCCACLVHSNFHELHPCIYRTCLGNTKKEIMKNDFEAGLSQTKITCHCRNLKLFTYVNFSRLMVSMQRLNFQLKVNHQKHLCSRRTKRTWPPSSRTADSSAKTTSWLSRGWQHQSCPIVSRGLRRRCALQKMDRYYAFLLTMKVCSGFSFVWVSL